MAKPGDVIEVPELNLRFEFRETAESTDGAYSEVDVVGRPNAGESITIPPGARHTQHPHGASNGRVRVRLEPSNDIDAFLERLGRMEYRLGFPKLRDGIRLLRDYPLLKLIDTEYTFVDEWDVAADPETVFDILADGQTYPEWWKPVYIGVKQEGEYTLQHFKGRLPYHLHTRTRTVEADRPHRIHGETDGDLRGTGIWTLTPTETGTRVRFDWRVHADRRLLKLLTPILRPALRWNHNWAIARAREGLEPYATQRAKVAA